MYRNKLQLETTHGMREKKRARKALSITALHQASAKDHEVAAQEQSFEVASP